MNSSTWKTWLAAVCLFLLVAAPAAAQTTDLFISEYIEGSSNNKAIEIYNGTGSSVDLAAGGYKIQMFFNGAATAGLTINLTGTVAAGDVYVVAHASANATILAQADQTNSSPWFNGDDAVALLKGTTVLDVVGQIGVDPGTEWGTGLTSTADNTLRRKSTICAGDPNGTDAFDPSAEWDGYATDTFGGLGAHSANCATNATIVLSCGSMLYVPLGSAATRSVTASDADGIVTSLDLTSVTPSPSAGTISRTAFTAASSTGGTATATISVDASVTAGSYVVLMTAANNDAVPQTGTCNFTVMVSAPVEIWEIQGSGPASPFTGQMIRTEDNIVTALAFGSTGLANGFFIQTPDARADLSAETSNGILVYTGSVPAVQVGDQVDVTATVSEYFEMTELGSPTVSVDSSGNALPAATLLTEISPGVFVPSHSQPWPANELERFEGMLVRVENGRTTAPTDAYGDVAVVAYGARAFREPGMAYPGELGYTTLWDGNPEIFEINPDGAGLPNVALPAGSIVQVAQGPLAYSFSDYQIWPTTFTYTAAALPHAVRARKPGEMTVASQNMLRFFDANPNNGPDDGPVTAQQYADRLAKASLHIRTVLGAPDVLAVEEIENVGVLQDLAARIAADDASLVYSAYLLEGHDVGGIDTGFLVRNTVSVDSVTQVGYNTLLSLDSSYLNDRPPLVLRGSYIANGAPFPITVIGVHGRSLSGIEGSTADAGPPEAPRAGAGARAVHPVNPDRRPGAPHCRDGRLQRVRIQRRLRGRRRHHQREPRSERRGPGGPCRPGHARPRLPGVQPRGRRALLLRLRRLGPGARSGADDREPLCLPEGPVVRARQR
jgi:predicted extracellular nuclease